MLVATIALSVCLIVSLTLCGFLAVILLRHIREIEGVALAEQQAARDQMQLSLKHEAAKISLLDSAEAVSEEDLVDEFSANRRI